MQKMMKKSQVEVFILSGAPPIYMTALLHFSFVQEWELIEVIFSKNTSRFNLTPQETLNY